MLRSSIQADISMQKGVSSSPLLRSSMASVRGLGFVLPHNLLHMNLSLVGLESYLILISLPSKVRLLMADGTSHLK